MKKLSFAIVIMLISITYCNAQDNMNSGKQYDNFAGVQVNNLIKQLLSNNTTATNNPYSLIYSINSRASGWGFRAGVGYNNNNSSSASLNSTSSTNGTGFQLRAGVEKAWKLSKRWSTGSGLDFVYRYSNTSSTNDYFGSDSSANTVKNITSSYGGGPMAWLRYSITDRILVGTEASFYYTAGNTNQTSQFSHFVVDTTSPTGMKYITTNNKINQSISSGGFQSPIVFFLMIKF